ncbi:MAG: hypothetical protein JKY49_02040 [Cohaesibacteraceae bacterium]|nr:hypothetical protein [Cohaesibacteraceae bacterium]MBL4876264.1 hypothetical protein [Cohaesibacteraceae bacterium]
MSIERDLGELSARLKALEEAQRSIAKDVRAVRDIVMTAKGSWKLVFGVSAAISAMVGFAVKLFPFLGNGSN